MMEMFGEVLNIVAKMVRVFGAAWCILGAFQWITGFKEHNGPDQKNGLLQFISGAAIFVLSYFIENIKNIT